MGEPVRNLIPYEEFDYQVLLGALKGYAHPRDRITTLLRKGSIIGLRRDSTFSVTMPVSNPIHAKFLPTLSMAHRTSRWNMRSNTTE
jgi:hypothetical protein